MSGGGLPAPARGAIAFLALLALHYSVRPLLGWRVEIDFLVIAVLLMAVRLRPGGAALLGLLAGLMPDAFAPASFGAGALAMTGIAFGASWLKAAFFADNLALNALFIFAGKWLFDLVYLFLGGRGSGSDALVELFLWSTLSAALTAVIGVVVLVIVRPLLERRPA